MKVTKQEVINFLGNSGEDDVSPVLLAEALEALLFQQGALTPETMPSPWDEPDEWWLWWESLPDDEDLSKVHHHQTAGMLDFNN